jgi:hypothetical protein
VTLLALFCGVGIWRLSRVQLSRPPLPPIEVVPLAGLGTFEMEAAFSPDGNHVAYADHSPSREGIYVTTVGSEKSLRLSSDFFDCCPRWSPDGGQVAFSRLTDGAADILWFRPRVERSIESQSGRRRGTKSQPFRSTELS